MGNLVGLLLRQLGLDSRDNDKTFLLARSGRYRSLEVE